MSIDEESFVLLSAYCDGELSPAEALAMERRLAAEPELRAMAERLGVLSGALEAALASPPAPPMLRSRIVQRLGFRDAPPRGAWRGGWRSLAAILLVGVFGGALIGSGVTYLGLSPGGEATTDAILAGHLRALAAPQPFDVASSDRHTVKPWFNGRTTIAPVVPDLAAEGFALLGGRIDVVDGKTVPTLVYRHEKHLVSVTIVPAGGRSSDGEERRAGSNIERWTAGDLAYWAISDLSADTLRRFVELFRGRLAGNG